MMRVLGHSPCPAFSQHPHSPTLPFLRFHPAPLRWDFFLCTAKLPISTRTITAPSDLYSRESSSTSFGRHKASASESRMKCERGSLFSNFLQLSFKYCFLSVVSTQSVCLNLTLWTFPPCNGASMGEMFRAGCFKGNVTFIPYIMFVLLFKRTIF